MEFKAGTALCCLICIYVDIGTEWNLKRSLLYVEECAALVDIGTEWNLKI